MKRYLLILLMSLLVFSCEEENTPLHDNDNATQGDVDFPDDASDAFVADSDLSHTDDGELTDDSDFLKSDEDFSLPDGDSLHQDDDTSVDVDIDAGYPYEDIPIVLCDTYQEATNKATIGEAILTEMSGFAVSLKNPGVIWTHNDSGSPAEIFAINKQGLLLGKVVLVGAAAEDWEDIALGRCGNEECIYIADTGDNLKKRTNLRVYRMREPLVDAVMPFGEIQITSFETFPFTYPDTAQDCEALAVNKEGVVYLFTKDIKANLIAKSKTFIYKFANLTDGVSQMLFSVGFIETGQILSDKAPQYAVTAASIDRTGNRLLLRMYSYLWEYRLPAGAPFEDIFKQSPLSLTTGSELQGESVDYDPYTGTIYHTSELFQGITPVLYGIDCQ
ncbi:hypothetical protein KAH37_01685 [bacterium]|nr:hypothetical protein [bacterium]